MDPHQAEEPQSFEEDVFLLLKEVNKTLKTIGVKHPCYKNLCTAAADVGEWFQNEDPQQMGWVGHDGLP